MTLFSNLSDNAKGALLMMCSMAAFTFNDLFIKAIGTDVPLSQLLLLRGILATIADLSACALSQGAGVAQTRQRPLAYRAPLRRGSGRCLFLPDRAFAHAFC